MTSSVTRTNPEDLSNNKLQPSDRAFHDWYRFVLSYPPHLVRHYINKFDLDANATLLDPFCGTGTTIVEAKKNGITSVGIEAVPMSHFACSTKVQWQVDLGELHHWQQVVRQQAHERVQSLPHLSLKPEQTAILLKNSISPVPLHKCLALQEAIATSVPQPVKGVLSLALAYVAVYDASNLKFGPEVGLRRQKRADAPVLEQWYAKVDQMAADLERHQALAQISSECRHGDARVVRSLLPPNSIDAVITSPPYPNEKDYTRTTRLESVLLGFLNNKQDLRSFKQTLIRSNTRNVYKVDDDDQFLATQSRATALAQEIEERRLLLQKTSGFERLYHRVVSLYFGGMKHHLQELQPVLKPGAQLAYVVGDQASFFQIMVRTGELLEEIAAEVGYVVKGRDLFRTRLATATGAQLKEEVVLLAWPGPAQKRQYFTG
ncbi:DNA methyltransferase [Oscillatoria sp. CS-180]|uniref:DNA methyltransferase n=1 Tax=Oscillatoria sp. CS-180 TaxID=3021720 RepID=UPI00232F390C|nr:DNA methyltransferase [Oscillatoria sp. CS-180]MDB9528906.1 DNA methyltransferase [Oscillatoria sp. CS-180]